jgi:hypothetical protein
MWQSEFTKWLISTSVLNRSNVSFFHYAMEDGWTTAKLLLLFTATFSPFFLLLFAIFLAAIVDWLRASTTIGVYPTYELLTFITFTVTFYFVYWGIDDSNMILAMSLHIDKQVNTFYKE